MIPYHRRPSRILLLLALRCRLKISQAAFPPPSPLPPRALPLKPDSGYSFRRRVQVAPGLLAEIFGAFAERMSDGGERAQTAAEAGPSGSADPSTSQKKARKRWEEELALPFTLPCSISPLPSPSPVPHF